MSSLTRNVFAYRSVAQWSRFVDVILPFEYFFHEIHHNTLVYASMLHEMVFR